MEAKGRTGKVEFDGRALHVHHMTGGTKMIPLKQVGAVSLREPTLFGGMGVWSVSVAGEVQSSKFRTSFGNAKDENSVVVANKKQYAAFKELTDAVNAAILDL